MFKLSGIALMIACATGSVGARDYTLVEKDTYGTGLYFNGTIVGDHVFVGSGLKKMERFDVSDPSALKKENDISTGCTFPVTKIVKDGNRVVGQCPFALEFYDATDPDNLTLTATYDSSGYAINGLVLEGNRLYLLGGNSEIVVFDASDLSNLVELGRANVDNVQTSKVIKVGNFLYAINSIEKLDIYDVSDPAIPSKVGSHPAVGTIFQSVEVIGNYAYVTTGTGIQVVDISDKSSPVVIKNIDLDAEANAISEITVTAYDGTHFIAIDNGKNIRTIDITTPTDPVISTSKFTLDYWANDAILKGDTLVIFNGVDGIRTIDISDINALALQDHFTNSIKPMNISMDGNSALIAGEGEAYHLFDIDADLNISERGRIGSYYNYEDSLLVGSNAFVNRNNSISTLDISDIDNPIETDIDTLGADWGSFTDYQKYGDQLIAGKNTAELAIYNIDPLGLSEVLSVDLGEDPDSNTYRGVVDITRKGDFIYVSTQETDVTIVDISDPLNPTIAHHEWANYDGSDRHLEIFGNRLFIARDIGLLVIDITNPASPQYVEVNSEFGLPQTIEAIDDRYAVISNETTLFLVDFQDETRPTIVHQLTTNVDFKSLAADLTKIVAADLYGSSVKTYQINQAPMTSDSAVIVDEDTELNEQLVGSDREDDTLEYTVLENVSNGNLILNSDGSYSFQAATNFFGSDSFTYQVADEFGGTTSGKVDITINPVNDAPTVDTEKLSIDEDNQLVVNIVANDVEGSELTFSLESEPSQGVMTLTSSGELTYDPVENFFGDVQFDVAVNDGELDSAVKTITITVVPVNDAPSATVEDINVDEDSSASGQANATDIESDTINFSLSQPAANGTATVNADGSYNYVPDENFNGSDSFSLVANDGTDDSAPVIVHVTVLPVNDAPTTGNLSATVTQGETLTGSITGEDVDGDLLTYSVESSPTNGNVTISASGQYSYTPNSDFVGSDKFTFTVSDPNGLTASGTVTVNVTEKSSSGGGALNWLLLLSLALIGYRNSKK